MPKFNIALEWTNIGFYEVEAETMQDAIDKVENCEDKYCGVPEVSDIVEESCSVREDLSHKLA